jgi:hypothetical protein
MFVEQGFMHMANANGRLLKAAKIGAADLSLRCDQTECIRTKP